MKYFILTTLLFFVFGSYYFNEKEDKLIIPVTVEMPITTETTKTFTVLIVPGHDTNSGGGNFRDVYERDLASTIGNKIMSILNNEPGYKAIVTRDTKTWNPIFSDYFKNNQQAILDFKNKKQAEDKILMSSGEKKYVPDMAVHSEVDTKTAIILYGINKWANENDISLVLHIHFNDSERPDSNLAGTFKGFAIYIPESQLINATTSKAIALSVYGELEKILSPEIIPNQKDSIIEDQSLIAIGASGTLEKPALLVEYGYIYEKPFRTEEDREIITDKIAEQTVIGINKYVSINK
jgi:N-acetylmuramoyl-L-alanine amidase